MPHLLGAIRTWTDIEHITLTNLSFPEHTLPLLPTPPSLRTLYLGQATFLPPAAVALMVARCPSTLELVRLVDTYHASIWGSRIRRRDIEKAEMGTDSTVERVRLLVRCEAKNERIMGGDRVENGTTILE